MQDRLGSIRLFFPVEVTGAYLGLQGVLAAQSVGESEYAYRMAVAVLVLVVINAWIYFKFRGLKSIKWHLVLALGFIIWAINIDMPRFEDIPYLGGEIEFYAPALLILYSLITSFLELPITDRGNERCQ